MQESHSTTARTVFTEARVRLVEAGIDEATLETRVLLARAMDVTPSALLLEPDLPMTTDEAAAFEGLLARRLTREPLAYIVGEREFYGLSLLVDHRVLIPRPETELLVESALAMAAERSAERQGLLMADVGTGSGCIVVSLAVHLPGARFYALDLSGEALALARSNAERHGVEERVIFLEGDVLAPLPEPVDMIVANPPYVPSRNLETIQPEIRQYEPRMALEGGPEGLDVARRVLTDAGRHLRPGGRLLMEIGHGQASEVVETARASFPTAVEIDMVPDLAGIPRVLRVRLP